MKSPFDNSNIPEGLQKLLQLASTDYHSKNALLSQRSKFADLCHIPLTETEKKILDSLPDDVLETMIPHTPANSVPIIEAPPVCTGSRPDFPRNFTSNQDNPRKQSFFRRLFGKK